MRHLLTCLLLLCTAPQLVLAQDDEDDGGWLTRKIEGALSGAGREVNIVGFAGALSSEASFEKMTIADAQGIWLQLDDVSLIWSRAALLRGRLEVDKLSAQSLSLPRLPEPAEDEPMEIPSAEAEPFKLELPDLPVEINIESFEVAKIDLGAPILGAPAQLSLKASAQLNDAGLMVDLAADRTDEIAGKFSVKTAVERDGSKIDIGLDLTEASGGLVSQILGLPDDPSVSLIVAGEGPLDDFTADIALNTDDAPRLAGSVKLLAEEPSIEDQGPDRRITADLGGDISALIAPEYKTFFGPDVGLSVNTLLVSDGSVDVEAFELSAQAVDLAGQVKLNADKWPSFIDIDGEVSQTSGPVVLPGSNAGISVASIILDVYFNAAEGDAFRGTFDIRDIVQEAATVERVGLVLDGILQGDIGGIGQFVTDLNIEASGLEMADEALAEVMGQTITGSTNIKFVENQPIEITDLNLNGPDYGLRGDVTIQGLENGFPTDLILSVNAQDLSRFAAIAQRPLAGAADLKVAGKITPLAGMFDVRMDGTAENIVLDIPQADAVLTGRTELSLAAKRDETGTFLRDLLVENDALDVQGDVSLRGVGSAVDARIKLADIALVLPDYEGAVALSLDASEEEAGWQVEALLDAPYDSRATISGVATGPDADLLFELSVPEVKPLLPDAEGPLDARGRLWQSPDGYLVDVKAGGPFGVDVTADGLATGPNAKIGFKASLPDLSVFIAELGGPLALEGDIAKEGENWRVDTDVNGPAGMTAQVEGTTAADASTVDLGIAGQVPLELAGPFLAPRSLQGQAAFDLAINGAPGLDAVSGRITTEDVVFGDPNLRLGLTGIRSQIDIASGALNLDVGGNIAAGGQLNVTGGMNLNSFAANLEIALRNAILTDPRIYAATLGADISIDGPLTGGARIAGTIDLAEVNVTVPGTGVTSIGEIPLIRHIGARSSVTQTRLKAGVVPSESDAGSGSAGPAYPLAIKINAPSKIYVRGRGLNAELGGALEVTGDSNNVISAGSFDLIRGRLDIIGKRFDLDEGTIQFQGSVTPYIRFVTVTEIPEGTASIIVDGEATEPEITFSAVPEAPQDEVLALIIFGRSVSQLSAFQALQLANGLAELSGRKGIGLVGGLREGFGLDELDVTTTDSGETSVTAGKYITDTIYTDVTSSADTGTDISLNIDLSDALTAKATVGSEGDSKLGLFFERDY